MCDRGKGLLGETLPFFPYVYHNFKYCPHLQDEDLYRKVSWYILHTDQK